MKRILCALLSALLLLTLTACGGNILFLFFCPLLI